jgi:NAD-dependent SIR2 family protein deacetylase
VNEPTPIVDDQEMLRAYAETIKLKDAEIERLKKSLEWWEETGRIKTAEIERLNKLKALLPRAADALIELHGEYEASSCYYCDLVAELRKAAE